ncbi:MAG TPA: GNAT family N-acetyltransferase [Dehalococcoidia bacterium]|jgi:predicted acetyltransferase|nr:GNAT family N-acetyltransferase [Dehalococcoidia bacterium]HIK88230.1 GNAT family N-acetyltransferase [Dehalococcoidia bacterium]
MTIEYRQITAAEHRSFGVAIERGFGGHYSPSQEQYRLDRLTLTPEMSMCAFDGGEIVGTSGAHPFETAVPGGAIIKNAGVTAVTVATTHRRQGLLNGMMKPLLRQERDKGQPVASLWASESIIYGRYGYGISIPHENFLIDTRKTKIKNSPEISGRIRFVNPDEARKLFPVAWEAAVNSHVGVPRRNDHHWDRWATGLNESGDGWSKPFLIVYEEDGKVLGYANYLVKELHVFGEHAHGMINADDVIHSSAASHAALWNHLLNVDLYDTLNTWRSPSDDSLPWMLEDQRQLERKPYDGVWYRLMDVAEALSTRTYLAEGSLVLEVEDSFIPEWGGRFELTGGPDGARCVPTTKAADITLPTASLAAIFLGGAKLGDLARAGRAEENTDGSIALADAMFATVRAPWCPMMF